MDDKLLQQCRLRIINLLTASKITIKKDAFDMIQVDGKTKYVKNGLKPVHCSADDFLKAGDIDNGESARKRVRLMLKNIKLLCDEARELTKKIDKDAKIKKKSIK